MSSKKKQKDNADLLVDSQQIPADQVDTLVSDELHDIKAEEDLKLPNSEEPVSSPEATKYPKWEIIASARIAFGVQPEVIVGALYGIGKDMFTKQEVLDLIQRFRTKPVKS